jgi:DNA mismatch repair ATPase MutL
MEFKKKNPNQKNSNQKNPNQKSPNQKNPNQKSPNQKSPYQKNTNQKNPNQKNPNYKYQKKDDIKLNSSLKAVKETDNKIDKPKEKLVTDWFFMTPSEINAKMIVDILKLKSNLQADIWEELNILQIELPGKTTMDFEPVNIDFKDPSDAAFIKNRNIKTIFAVTIEEGAFEEMKEVFKQLIEEFEGFLCADSADFKPIYDHESMEE